jgi:ribosomal protein S11
MRPLSVTLTATRDGGPLAVINGLPGDGAELRPDALRALAAALLKVADDADARPATHRGKRLPPARRAYPLTPEAARP